MTLRRDGCSYRVREAVCGPWRGGPPAGGGGVTLELRRGAGTGGEAGGASEGSVFREEGTTCAKSGRLEAGWRCENRLRYTCFSLSGQNGMLGF